MDEAKHTSRDRDAVALDPTCESRTGDGSYPIIQRPRGEAMSIGTAFDPDCSVGSYVPSYEAVVVFQFPALFTLQDADPNRAIPIMLVGETCRHHPRWRERERIEVSQVTGNAASFKGQPTRPKMISITGFLQQPVRSS